MPVKKTSDLLLVMSNLYSLDHGSLEMSPKVTKFSNPSESGIINFILENVSINSTCKTWRKQLQEGLWLSLSFWFYPWLVGAWPHHCVGWCHLWERRLVRLDFLKIFDVEIFQWVCAGLWSSLPTTGTGLTSLQGLFLRTRLCQATLEFLTTEMFINNILNITVFSIIIIIQYYLPVYTI